MLCALDFSLIAQLFNLKKSGKVLHRFYDNLG